MGRRTFTFVFVCQAGALENKALVLAASLKRHLQCEYELVAAVPTPAELWGTPGCATIDILRRLGVRIIEIKNEIDPGYPIGNKVSCLRIGVDSDRLVFLDTDMVLAGPFSDDSSFDFPFAAKPADLPSAISRRQWKRAYAAGKTQLPDAWVATTVCGQIVHPYFNAGFIAVDPRSGVGDAWLECCKRIDVTWGIQQKRPHLDQIALPVAVHKLKLPYNCLDERYNFPAHLKPIGVSDPPSFVHYHASEVLRREPTLVDLVQDLCRDHTALAERLDGDADYAPLLHRRMGSSAAVSGAPASAALPIGCGPAAAQTPELIITGIPRSGTSFLCNLLHRFDNTVILNEPAGIARPLRREPIPFGVGTFFRDIRRDVLEGRPIQNKLRDGKVTDETMEANEQTEYTPCVTDAHFVLGAKSPLGFLTRLRALGRAMPHARIVACVRNPVDTLASWKTSFTHLKTADVAAQLHGGLRDPFLSARDRSALEDVAAIKSEASRRAAWWRYFAEILLDSVPDLILVHYATLVTDPRSVVDRILDGFNAGGLREPIEPSMIRAEKRTVLGQEDHQAIRALCGQAAAALGVAEPSADVSPVGERHVPVSVETVLCGEQYRPPSPLYSGKRVGVTGGS